MKDETIHPWALLMDQTAYSGPLCHLEQAEPLIPLGQPGGEALTAALTEGRPVPLCPGMFPWAVSGSLSVVKNGTMTPF